MSLGMRELRVLERAAAALPQTADEALFRIGGGLVRVFGIYGIVTTVIQTQANNTKLKHNPSGVGADVDLCAVLDISADAVGTVYSIVGVLATALKSTTLWLAVPADMIPAQGIVLGPGDIELDCAASNTGAIRWVIEWQPIESAGLVSVVPHA